MKDVSISPGKLANATSCLKTQDRFLWRYGVVTTIFCLWVVLWFVLDDIYNLWLLIFLPILIPAIFVVVYLFIAFLSSIIRDQQRRLSSVGAGAFGGVFIVVLATFLVNQLGFTTDYARFLSQRDVLTAHFAKLKNATQPPHFSVLNIKSGFVAVSSVTVVAYDPSRQMLLPPKQRSQDWTQRASLDWDIHARVGTLNGNHVFYSRDMDEYRQHVSVRHLEGDFYAVTLE